MKRRVAILTEIIAPYRIPVFNALAACQDIDLHVIFLSETDPTLRQWPIYKDEIRFSHEVLTYWRRRVGKYHLLVNRGLGTSLERYCPDAIVCGGYNYFSSWNAALWARRHGVPLLLWSESTAQDSRVGRATIEFLKMCFLRSCRGFIVPGKSAFSYLRHLGVASSSIFTAPNAVDVTSFSNAAEAVKGSSNRSNLASCSRFFLYVGRLVIEKGIFELLEAYAKLEPEVRAQVGLIFAGDGPAKSELLRQISHVDSGFVHCVGFLNREQLAELYASAEALVLPTHSDTWGFVVNEAMACGTPVITTNVAGCVPDLVEDGGNGFVFSARDVPALTSAMRQFLKNPGLRKRMGAHCKNLIQSFSPESWAAGVVEALDFVCEKAA